MIYDLKSLFNRPGEQMLLEYSIPAEALADVQGYCFASPVQMTGMFRNRAGIVTLHYTAVFSLSHACDRCLKAFVRDYSYDFSHTIVQSLASDEDDDAYIVAADARVNADEIAVTDLLLQLPTKILCREDCRGLCGICGCDLNESTCNCQK